jgi:FdhD protein
METVERPPLRGPSGAVRIVAVEGDAVVRRRDRLATEEPLEIRVGSPGQPAAPVTVNMRTPGHDFELAAGFLFTEGLLPDRDAIASMAYCADVADTEQRYNVLTVELRDRFDAARLQRNFYASSSCGVCGKASIEGLEVRTEPLGEGPTVSADTLRGLPATLLARQRVFDATGGLHATGLFTPAGELLALREDVGRHNAMDKLVGWSLIEGLTPLGDHVAMVSGRASFELVQKAAVAGITVLCAVSAPSTLAVDTAKALGMTLVGFLRGDRFNVYTHPRRITLPR